MPAKSNRFPPAHNAIIFASLSQGITPKNTTANHVVATEDRRMGIAAGGYFYIPRLIFFSMETPTPYSQGQWTGQGERSELKENLAIFSVQLNQNYDVEEMMGKFN